VLQRLYQEPQQERLLPVVQQRQQRQPVTFEGRSRIFVDGSNPSFIRALKDKVDEDTNYEQQISFYKKQYPSGVYDLQFLTQSIFVIPIHFSKEQKNMLVHCKQMME
jgi:hypothetical protein